MDKPNSFHFSPELLEQMHPTHFVMDENGVLHFCSRTLHEAFPDAQSIRELLAPNSSEELLSTAMMMASNHQSTAYIELFSIQQYSIWPSKIFYLQDKAQWLICKDDALSEKALKPRQNLAHNAQHEAIVLRNEFYEALLQQLPAEVAVFDPEFKFLFVNQNAIKNEELRNWLIGRSEIEYWKSKKLPLDKALLRLDAFKQAIAERKSTAVEEIFHAGTEKEKHYMRVTHPYFKEDELQFLLTYGIDITNVKKTELQLMRQNSELEKVNHELDQFVYSASHNLRAPLLSMKGLLHLAEQDETSAATRKQFIGEAFKSIERLDATIKDIIDYSKNARLELVPVLIDWTNLIQSTFNDLRFYEQRPIALELKIADSGNFLSDEKRLKSIVHNIISNSIKYNDSSKEKSWMQVTISCNSETCDCTFTDNGIGIPLQNQERVFDMFYRATSAGSGSGLGLYIAKEMIERIGGKIQLQSTPGVGTDIQITLPNLRH